MTAARDCSEPLVSFRFRIFLALWLLLVASPSVVRALQPSFFPQSWFFDWNPAGTTVPIPVTEQCETIHITWERGSATGPNPTAPYYLQVYTSTFIVPFTVEAGSGTSFDFAVPFIPGTQYQICMFDKNGATGGCQDIYTVIANTSTTSPSCANVTFPAGAMSVEAAISGAAFSQYGWIPQCTDIAVTPVNGTPPYTFTVAPALRPPLNITSSTMATINWTNTLAFGLPYFISLIDSVGNKWSQGPLHSASGEDGCLSTTVKSNKTGAIAGGSAIAGLVAGAVCTALCFSIASRKRSKRHPGGRYRSSGKRDDSLAIEPSESVPLGAHPTNESTSSRGTLGTLPYHVEPFPLTVPGPDLHSQPAPPGAAASTLTSTSSSQPDTSEQDRRMQVYVVHHDGGRAPVTVYTDDSAQITELPPGYMDDRAPRRQRQPRATPVKPRRGNRPPPDVSG